MGHFYGSEIHGSHSRLLIALFGAMLPLTVGGNIIWLEPPPFEANASSISRTIKQVILGSLNEELSCSFSLTTDLKITTVSMKFRGQPAVAFVPNVSLMVEPVFAKHFDAVWVPNKLTLIFFNVTDAQEGEYCCEVIAIGRPARSWIRKIQLLVLDPSQTMVSSITVSQSPIPTTVSAITASEDQRQTPVSTFTALEDQRQITVSTFIATEDQRQTAASAVTASKVDFLAVFIATMVGLVTSAIIMMLFPSLKRRKRFEMKDEHASSRW